VEKVRLTVEVVAPPVEVETLPDEVVMLPVGEGMATRGVKTRAALPA